jgi:hypothetical protein
MILVLGYVFASILSIMVVMTAYSIAKAIIDGFDLTRWRLQGIPWSKIKTFPKYKQELLKMLMSNIWERLTTSGISYSRNGKRWDGYGTGR